MTTHWLFSSISVLCAFAYILSALRLLTFSRAELRYRRGVSVVALLLIQLLLIAALLELLYLPGASPLQLLSALFLLALIRKTDGNVAALLRLIK